MKRKITDEFILKHAKAIKAASVVMSHATFSPRRKIVEMARKEFNYSEGTLAADIWHAIRVRYNEHFKPNL